MDSTIQALGGLLLRSIPTFLLVFALHIYLKRMFFTPLEKVLAKRREATEGAREGAEAVLRAAAEKAAGYEAALQKVRLEILRDQDETKKNWLAEQARHLETARAQARELLAKAKAEIAAEAEAARRELGGSTGPLAAQIAERALNGRVN